MSLLCHASLYIANKLFEKRRVQARQQGDNLQPCLRCTHVYRKRLDMQQLSTIRQARHARGKA